MRGSITGIGQGKFDGLDRLYLRCGGVFTNCFLYFCCFCSWPWHICNKQTKPQ